MDIIRFLLRLLPLITFIVLFVMINKSNKEAAAFQEEVKIPAGRMPLPDEEELIKERLLAPRKKKFVIMQLIFLPIDLFFLCGAFHFVGEDNMAVFMFGMLAFAAVMVNLGAVMLSGNYIQDLKRGRYEVYTVRVVDVDEFRSNRGAHLEYYRYTVRSDDGIEEKYEVRVKNSLSEGEGSQGFVVRYGYEDRVNKKSHNGRYIKSRDLIIP